MIVILYKAYKAFTNEEKLKYFIFFTDTVLGITVMTCGKVLNLDPLITLQKRYIWLIYNWVI